MDSETIKGIIGIAIFVIGCLVYIKINQKYVGTESEDKNGTYIVTEEDIYAYSIFWWLVLILWIVTLPIKFIMRCYDKRRSKEAN